jgi:hypothetical protein
MHCAHFCGDLVNTLCYLFRPDGPREPRSASARVFQFPRHVASTCKEAGDRNILVEVFPVQANAGEFDLLALLLCRVEQARKPCERHTDCAAVGQINPHRVFVKTDRRRRNGQATLVR